MRTNLLLIASLCVLGCRSTTDAVAEERTEPARSAETTVAQGDDRASRAGCGRPRGDGQRGIRFYADEAAQRAQETSDADARASDSDGYARDMEAYARWLEREGVAASPAATAATQAATDEEAMAERHAHSSPAGRLGAGCEGGRRAAGRGGGAAPVVFVPGSTTRSVGEHARRHRAVHSQRRRRGHGRGTPGTVDRRRAAAATCRRAGTERRRAGRRHPGTSQRSLGPAERRAARTAGADPRPTGPGARRAPVAPR